MTKTHIFRLLEVRERVASTERESKLASSDYMSVDGSYLDVKPNGESDETDSTWNDSD